MAGEEQTVSLPSSESLETNSSRYSFLDLPPELRNMVYKLLLQDLTDSIQNAALRFVHESAASEKRPLTVLGYAPPTPKNYLPARPAILSAHPILRDKFAIMYRLTLLRTWVSHADLFQEKLARYLEKYAGNIYETRGRGEELLYIVEFGHSLADFLVRELCCVGLAQLSHGERFMCSQARALWESHKELGSSDSGETSMEKMQGSVNFASSFIESVAFRPKARVVLKEDKLGLGYKA